MPGVHCKTHAGVVETASEDKTPCREGHVGCFEAHPMVSANDHRIWRRPSYLATTIVFGATSPHERHPRESCTRFVGKTVGGGMCPFTHTT